MLLKNINLNTFKIRMVCCRLKWCDDAGKGIASDRKYSWDFHLYVFAKVVDPQADNLELPSV